MEPTKKGFRLSTGREFDAYRSILGISPHEDHERLRATYGYDGSVEQDEPDYLDGKPYGENAFTPAERQEIAAYMIDLWKKWSEQR